MAEDRSTPPRKELPRSLTRWLDVSDANLEAFLGPHPKPLRRNFSDSEYRAYLTHFIREAVRR